MNSILSRTMFAGCLILAATFVLPATAFSAPPRARVRAHQAKQVKRIHRGVRTGQITRVEARRLGREQRRIQKSKRHMRRNDGRLDRREQRRLNRMQRRSKSHIFRARHNRRHR